MPIQLALAAVAGAGTIASMFGKGGSRSAAKASKKLMKEQKKGLELQRKIASSLWAEYNTLRTRGIRDQFLTIAEKAGTDHTEEAIGKAKADVGVAYQGVRDAVSRSLQKYGLSPGDDVYGRQQREIDIAEGGDTADAVNQARIAERERYLQQGHTILGSTLQFERGGALAAADISSDASRQAGTAAYGQQMQALGSQQQAMQSLGTAARYGLDWWNSRPQVAAPYVPAAGAVAGAGSAGAYPGSPAWTAANPNTAY